MALAPGTRITHYEIREPLGSGGMGEVYRARDLTLNRDVALKFLPPHLTDDADRLRRFEQEARAASALNHPAIVSIYELGRADQQPFISMELVDGQTLRQVAARGKIPSRRLLSLATQIAGALAKAHAAGIVHRDLKPDNLMITSDGHAKILDFGVAKLTGDPTGGLSEATTIDKGTKPGALVGTVAYMSPEQASGGDVDFRSDQFSFGLVLYELLTGRRPFQRSTSVETLSAIIRDDVPPIDLSDPALAPVEWIVDRCLAKTPSERYASTHDLALDLTRVRERSGDRTASPVSGKRTGVGRREFVAWTAVGALAVAGLAVFTLGFGRTSRESRTSIRFTFAAPTKGDFAFTVGVLPFALSPDGHRLAFLAAADGTQRQQAWLHSFDSLESRPIAGTEDAVELFWSPDGATLGFFANGKMKRVPIAGGDVTTICDANGGGGTSWNRQDVILFSAGENASLWRVNATGGAPVQVTKLDAGKESGHMWPTFLPDGQHFVFSLLGQEFGLYLGALDSPERTFLGRGYWPAAVDPDWLFFVDYTRKIVAQRLDLAAKKLVGDPVPVADEVAIMGPTPAVSVSSGGNIVYWSGLGSRDITQLTWMRRDGTPLGNVGDAGPYLSLQLSPDDKVVAVDRFDLAPSIFLIDVARGSASKAAFGPYYEGTPIWSPDGHSFVFASARDSPPNLYVANVDNTQADPRRLTTSVIQHHPQSWSRDGLIAFIEVHPKTQGDIWIIPASGKEPARPLIRTGFNEGSAMISPDGRWLAYVSTESGRGEEVYVTRFPQGTGKWTVSVGGGSWPIWHPNSRELYYRRPDGMLMAVSVGPGSEFTAGVPQTLFVPHVRSPAIGAGSFYDVATDGRFLVNVFVERRTTPATVILNWAPPK